MTHLDEGLLRALLDGETAEGDTEAARAHLDQCDSCQALSVQLREASALVGAALRHLDTVEPPASAKAAVLARVGADARTAPTERFAFARAAIIVLFFGVVVATALPASPVRGWLVGGWTRTVALFTGPTPSDNAVASVEREPTPQAAEPAGVRLEVGTGDLVVLLQDIEPDTELEVRFVEGFQAGAFAAQPARFRTASGLIEVIGGSGRVRIDIPRSLEVASIRVNGRMYLTKAGDELDIAGPILTRTSDEIRLRIQ